MMGDGIVAVGVGVIGIALYLLDDWDVVGVDWTD